MNSLLVAILVPVVLLAIGALSHSQASQVEGWHVVEYNRGLKGFAWFMTVLASGVAIGSLFLSGTDRLYMLGISAIFALPAGALFFVSYGMQVAFNDQGMKIKKPMKKAVFVRWEQVVYVKSSSHGSYIVELQDNGRLDVHAYMSGVSTLLRQMQRLGIRGALLAEALQTES